MLDFEVHLQGALAFASFSRDCDAQPDARVSEWKTVESRPAVLTSRATSRLASSEVEDAPEADGFFGLDGAVEPAAFAASLISWSDIVLAPPGSGLRYLEVGV